MWEGKGREASQREKGSVWVFGGVRQRSEEKQIESACSSGVMSFMRCPCAERMHRTWVMIMRGDGLGREDVGGQESGKKVGEGLVPRDQERLVWQIFIPPHTQGLCGGQGAA
jgi:hypothetical protein